MTKNSYRNAAGFSLIELMIALVAGMIVVGAVLAFTMSSLRANADYIGATRLTQELRTNLNLVTDELRRAGYDEDAMNYVARPVAFSDVSPFATINIPDMNTDDSCVVFAYDRLPGTPGMVDLSNGEIRAFRRRDRTVGGQIVGVLEFAESSNSGGTAVTPSCTGAGPTDYDSYPVSCNDATGWCAISDPRVIDISVFRVDNDLDGVAGADGVIPGTSTVLPMQLRRLDIELQGHLVGDAGVVRGVRANVRVRADCVRPNVATNCAEAPTGT